MYLGSLHPWKGVENLIRAMPEIQGAQLWIAGGSEMRIAELQRLARDLGCTEKIEFLGSVPPIKRFETIDQADICLLPLSQTSIGSRYTSPLKLFEYMAMGKPIIVSDLPAIREVLAPEETALLVEPENPSAIAAAVNRLMEDVALATRLGTQARALAWAAYSWTARAQRMAGFIQQQIDPARA